MLNVRLTANRLLLLAFQCSVNATQRVEAGADRGSCVGVNLSSTAQHRHLSLRAMVCRSSTKTSADDGDGPEIRFHFLVTASNRQSDCGNLPNDSKGARHQ